MSGGVWEEGGCLPKLPELQAVKVAKMIICSQYLPELKPYCIQMVGEEDASLLVSSGAYSWVLKERCMCTRLSESL